MKTIFHTIIFGLLIASANAESPDPILSSPMPRIILQKAYLPEIVEFFRMKGTEELRQQSGDPTAILKFDYEFDPSKNRPIVNYDRKDMTFGAAFREILDEQGLVIVVTNFDRMKISDATNKK